MRNKTNWIIIIAIIMLIPVILNFILQIRTNLCILGGSEVERSWLSFWGDFLAAIAAGFLGWVSLDINKKSIAQNEKILHNNAWEKMVANYNKLEDYVVAQEKLHSQETIDKIKAIVTSKDGNNLENKIRLLNIKAQLREASIKIARYVDEGRLSDSQSKAEYCLSKYGNALRAANTGMIKFIEDSYKSICPEQNETDKSDRKECELSNSCSEIMTYGFDFLNNKKIDIIEYAKEHGIAKGSFI